MSKQEGFHQQILSGFNKLLISIFLIRLDSSLQASVFLTSSPRIYARHYWDSPILCVSRPDVRKDCNSCAGSTQDPKHLMILVCLEELALVTNRMNSKIDVLVRMRVKECSSNTGV